jgi:peroxiredoxin Q/BCP
MLKSGTAAPDFALPDQDGATVRLQDLLSEGPLILYFYPADFTPGCTREACSIRDLHAELRQAGLQVVGVSPQSAESHRRFRDKHGLPFTLLADPDKAAIKAYDVDGPFGFGVRRATFLINRNAQIQAAVLADLRIAEHEAFIREALSTAGG